MKLVGLAFALGLFIRLVGVATIPRGFTPDEAAFGYNAYSLLQTGFDEWGTPFWRLPFTNLKSFGDYKLPLYAYLDVPFVAILGLNELSVRLPNVIIGSLGVVVIALCSKKLFPSYKSLPAICAFFFALNPWSIQLSRGGFEANLTATFLPLFICLYLSRKWLATSFIAALNAYSYHSARYLTPVIFLALLLLFPIRNRLKSLLVFLALLLPGLLAMFSSASSRVADVSILSPTDRWASVSDARFEAVSAGEPDMLARIFTNKLTSSASLLKNNWLQYYSPQFLFSFGPAESTYGMVKGHGVMYSVEILFFILIVIHFVKNPSKTNIFLLFLLALSSVPAALAKGPGYAANRSASLIPFMVLASGLGFYLLFTQKFKYRFLLVSAAIFIYLFQVVAFSEKYFVHSPFQTAQSMNYGWQEVLARSQYAIAAADQVYIDTGLSEPQIFTAFYLGISPRLYQQSSSNWSMPDPTRKFLDQYVDYSLDKFVFTRTESLDNITQKSLIISLPKNQPKNTTESFHVDYPNGQTAIVVSSPKL